MRLSLAAILVAASVSFVTGPAYAEDAFPFGQDVYLAGTDPTLDQEAGRDALLAGFSVVVDAKVGKDAHATGFDVDIGAPIGADLYALGFSIKVSAPVGEDLTASGANIRLSKAASVGGNARLVGGTIVVDAPVAGSLLAAAGDLTLDAAVSGDAQLTAGTLTFGPHARIDGKLSYSAPEPIAIPATVIAPERVSFTKLEHPSQVSVVTEGVGQTIPNLWPSFLGIVFGFAFTLAFLVGLGWLFMHFAPRFTDHLREAAIREPGKAIGFGILGLAALIGLVPLAAMTLIGLPLIPFILLAILLFWTGGYLIGVYAVSWQMAKVLAKPTQPTIPVRLLVLALGLIVFALLNFIPFVGWLINLLAVLFGMGGIAQYAIGRFLARKASPLPSTVLESEGDGI
jgi:hypothetical protein